MNPLDPPLPRRRLRLLHASAGRCRWRLDSLGRDALLRQAVEHGLHDHPDVRSHRINPACDSLVVEHREGRIESIAQRLRELAAGRPAAPPAQEPSGAPPAAPDVAQAFGWSGCALVLALAGSQPLALCSVALSGLPILRRAAATLLSQRRLNVDFLDALALSISVLRGDSLTGAVMTALVNLGDVIRERTANRSHRHVQVLLAFQDMPARLLAAGGESRMVKARELETGQQVLLLAGDVVPADGLVRRGLAAVDQRSITGESVPATLACGDPVYAGSAVAEGSLVLEVTHAGSRTTVARIAQALDATPLGETRAQNYAEKFTDRLVAPLLAANLGLFAATRNLDRLLAMAIIDFGTGIRVAAPTGVLSSMSQAAREGILIKAGRQIEHLAGLRAIAFDKTGTLTRGQLSIVQARPLCALGAGELLALAAAAESHVRHPVARALVAHATQGLGLAVPACEDVEYRIGLGVSAKVGGRHVLVGNERFLRAAGVALRRAAACLRQAHAQGAGSVLVAVDGALAGVILYRDELRPESARVVETLRRRRIGEIVMVTGDRGALAHSIARSVGIRRVYPEVLPSDKAEIIRALHRAGSPIAMVGDGVNDSLALAQADVGITLADGSEMAREAADVVLLRPDLTGIVRAVDISQQAMRLLAQNHRIVMGSNALALLLAVPRGLLSPFAATVLSNGSTLVAALNGMRPLLEGRVEPGHQPGPASAGGGSGRWTPAWR